MKTFLNLLAAFFILYTGVACTQTNPGTTQVGNPTIRIGQLQSDGSSQIEIPLALLGGAASALSEVTIDIAINGTTRNSDLIANDYYHATTETVLFNLISLADGDVLSLTIHLSDGSSATYSGTVSDDSAVEATAMDSNNAAANFDTDDFNFFLTFETDDTTLIQVEPDAFTDSEAYSADDVAGASLTAMAADDVVQFEFDATDNFYVVSDSSLTGMVRKTYSTSTVNSRELLDLIATRTDSTTRRFSVDFGDITQSYDTLDLSFVAFTGDNTDSFYRTYNIAGSGEYTYSSSCTVDFVRANDVFIDTSLSDSEIQNILDNGQTNTYANSSYQISASSGRLSYTDRSDSYDYWDWVGVYNSDQSFTAARRIEVNNEERQLEVYTGTVTETEIDLDAAITLSDGTDSCTVTFSLAGTVN